VVTFSFKHFCATDGVTLSERAAVSTYYLKCL